MAKIVDYYGIDIAWKNSQLNKCDPLCVSKYDFEAVEYPKKNNGFIVFDSPRGDHIEVNETAISYISISTIFKE